MSSGLTDPVISGGWSVDMNCITSGNGGRRTDINVLDCCHYCGSCSIQELFECEWDACRSVGWRLQASWRLRARRIDDAVQSQPTAASLFTICLVDAACLNSHRTNYYPYLWLCCFVIFQHGKIPLCPTRNLRISGTLARGVYRASADICVWSLTSKTRVYLHVINWWQVAQYDACFPYVDHDRCPGCHFF